MEQRVHFIWGEGVSPAFQSALRARLPALFEGDVEAFRTHARSTVVRATVAGRPVIAKRYNTEPSLPGLAKRALRHTHARRAWRNARRLEALGLSTPRVLALVVARERFPRRVEYLITEYVPGPSLDTYLADPLVSEAARRGTARALMAAVRRLHDARLVHGDLKARNVLVTAAGEPCFIDLDTLTAFPVAPVRGHWIAKDYQRLCTTAPALRTLLAGSEKA